MRLKKSEWRQHNRASPESSRLAASPHYKRRFCGFCRFCDKKELNMIKILIDCFGGDHSPEANVDGALVAMAKMPDLYLILTGDEATL